jgi:hypothetical protein
MGVSRRHEAHKTRAVVGVLTAAIHATPPFVWCLLRGERHVVGWCGLQCPVRPGSARTLPGFFVNTNRQITSVTRAKPADRWCSCQSRCRGRLVWCGWYRCRGGQVDRDCQGLLPRVAGGGEVIGGVVGVTEAGQGPWLVSGCCRWFVVWTLTVGWSVSWWGHDGDGNEGAEQEEWSEWEE